MVNYCKEIYRYNPEGNYVGFDFDADDNIICQNHNKSIIENHKEHFKPRNFQAIKNNFHSHEGMFFFAKYPDSIDYSVNYSGETTEEIINDLIINQDEIFEYLVRVGVITTPKRIIPNSLRYNICKRQNWKCNNCGIDLSFSKNHKYSDNVAQIDHIHPFCKYLTYWKGAEHINDPDNLQALCKECNRLKYNRGD